MAFLIAGMKKEIDKKGKKHILLFSLFSHGSSYRWRFKEFPDTWESTSAGDSSKHKLAFMMLCQNAVKYWGWQIPSPSFLHPFALFLHWQTFDLGLWCSSDLPPGDAERASWLSLHISGRQVQDQTGCNLSRDCGMTEVVSLPFSVLVEKHVWSYSGFPVRCFCGIWNKKECNFSDGSNNHDHFSG